MAKQTEKVLTIDEFIRISYDLVDELWKLTDRSYADDYRLEIHRKHDKLWTDV